MRLTLERIAAAVFALLAALAAWSWIAAREDRARLGATLAAQQQVITDAQKREDSRAADLRAALDQIAALKRTVVTPAEVLRALPDALPKLPRPITLNANSPSASSTSANGAGKSPAGASSSSSTSSASSTSDSSLASATIPQADLKPLYDYLQDCRACQVQLTSTQADLADERIKSAALTKERDTAVKAAKGGGFWSRVKHGAKWFAIGAAIGAVAALSAH
jgi:hypothetical protein